MGNKSLPIRSRDSLARRRALRLGYINGVLWSIGNGLTSGSLITYLAIELGAKGVGVSMVLAIQSFVGVMRVMSPSLIERIGGARRACLTLTFASYSLLFFLPTITLEGSPLRWFDPVVTLVGLLCIHQLLEQLGTVALWAWWADIVPLKVRGRYFGRRSTMQLVALVPAVWISGRFIDEMKQGYPSWYLACYALVTAVGATFLLSSIIPLWFMPARIGKQRRKPTYAPTSARREWRELLTPLGAVPFRRVLYFGLWASIVNGLTQSAQNIYPKQVLHVGLGDQAQFVTIMRLGQAVYSWWIGPFSDRYGNRPALIVSQLLQASGMIFFALSAPLHSDWLYGAWIAWSAFAGINLCAPNLLLKLAPRGRTAAYIGFYTGVTGATYAIGTLAGGYLHDKLRAFETFPMQGVLSVETYHALFLCGWVLRSMAVLWLVRVIEPGAWSWKNILGARGSKCELPSVST